MTTWWSGIRKSEMYFLQAGLSPPLLVKCGLIAPGNVGASPMDRLGRIRTEQSTGISRGRCETGTGAARCGMLPKG